MGERLGHTQRVLPWCSVCNRGYPARAWAGCRQLVGALKVHLRGTPCRAFGVSMKVQVADQSGHAELVLNSVGLRLAMGELFDGVEVPAG